MSKLSPRRLTVEDFKEQASWIGKLLSPMNDFIQQVYAGWNNGLTTDENLYREIKELKFTVDTTTYPIRFKPKFAANPKGFNLIYYRESNGVAFTQVPCINLDIGSGGLVELSSIGGLTNGSTYTLRLEVIYG